MILHLITAHWLIATLLVLGLAGIVAVGVYAPASALLVWKWLIGTKPGQIVLLVLIILLTLAVSHHIVWTSGYDARVAEDAAAQAAANAKVVAKNAADAATSAHIADTSRTESAAARSAAATTTADAVTKIRTITRTITVQANCAPPTPADVAANAAIDAEGQAAVERARKASHD